MNRRSRLHDYANRLQPDQMEQADGSPALAQVTQVVRRIATHTGNMEDAITAAFPQLAQSFSDAPLSPGTGNTAVPQPCQFTVKQSGGFSVIEITLPQNQKPLTAQTASYKIRDNPNALLSEIRHRFQSASSTAFNKAAGVKTYESTTQIHLTLLDGNSFWRIQSSYNGKDFNAWSAGKKAV